MNILMALSQLEITGAEVYATTIADELIARGNKVFIVSDTLTVPTKAEYIKLEFNKRSLGKRINHVKTLYKFIKDNDIHIVHHGVVSLLVSWQAYLLLQQLMVDSLFISVENLSRLSEIIR